MQVFVYGTLTDEAQVATLLDEFAFRGDAVLEGLHRVDGEYPTLAPGGTVVGRILQTDDVETLDAYEGVDRGLYVRVPVAVEGDAPFGVGRDGDRTVEVYVGDPTRLAVTESVSWASDESGPASFEDRVRAVTADCVVRPAP